MQQAYIMRHFPTGTETCMLINRLKVTLNIKISITDISKQWIAVYREHFFNHNTRAFTSEKRTNSAIWRCPLLKGFIVIVLKSMPII